MRKYDRKTGAENDVQIWAPSLAEAKQSKLTVMHYRGLAKASWGWAAQRLFPGQKVGYGGRKPQREVLAVTQRGKGNGYEIVIMNKLDYIGLALKGGDPQRCQRQCVTPNTMFGRIEQRRKGKSNGATRAQIERHGGQYRRGYQSVTTRHVELFWCRRTKACQLNRRGRASRSGFCRVNQRILIASNHAAASCPS